MDDPMPCDGQQRGDHAAREDASAGTASLD